MFMAFIFGLLAAMTLEQLAVMESDGDIVFSNRLVLDVIFLGLTPSFAALLVSTPYLRLRTIWEDPFTKRMAFYRSLPIPLNVLAMSRTMLTLMVFIIMLTVFYTTMYVSLVLSGRFLSDVAPAEFMMFVLFWVGYALLLSGGNTFIESGTNGKMLHLFPFINMLVLLLVIAVTYHLSKKGIVEWALIFVQYSGWLGVLAALLSGMAGCYVWHIVLTRRLSTRDYL